MLLKVTNEIAELLCWQAYARQAVSTEYHDKLLSSYLFAVLFPS